MNALLKSNSVMARFGYKSRSAFWQFVRSQGVPFIRLNARTIKFCPTALASWEKSRTAGA